MHSSLVLTHSAYSLVQILKPCSWTSFDVCVLLYGLLFENVIWCGNHIG